MRWRIQHYSQIAFVHPKSPHSDQTTQTPTVSHFGFHIPRASTNIASSRKQLDPPNVEHRNRPRRCLGHPSYLPLSFASILSLAESYNVPLDNPSTPVLGSSPRGI